MAKQKEEILLEFSVEQADAIKELEKTKKSIIQVKEEQSKLQKAYKSGEVAIEEYAKEQVRLEAILKRQQSVYINLQKSVTGVKTQFDKLIEAQREAASSMQASAGKFKELTGVSTVAGKSVEELSTKMAAFTNPVTAAVGAVTALVALYASSATGARDLASAQNQLSIAAGLATNAFGEQADKLLGGDGTGKDGLFGKLAYAFNQYVFGFSSAILAKVGADTRRKLQELEVLDVEAKRVAKNALDQSEQFRQTRDNADLSFGDRLDAARQVQGFVDVREKVLLNVQRERLKAAQTLLSLDKENLELQKAVRAIQFEIADIQEDSQGKRTEALNGILALEREIRKAQGENSADARARRRAGSGGQIGGLSSDVALISARQDLEVDAEFQKAQILTDINERLARDLVKRDRRTAEERKKTAKEFREFRQAQDQMLYDSSEQLLSSLGALFGDNEGVQKGFALTQIGVDTAQAISALAKASEQNPFNGTTFGAAGLAQYVAGFARILANMAAAKQYLGFAGGGYTGPGGKFEPAGIVHKGEVVFSQDDVNALGGPQVVNRMRPTFPKASLKGGYFDGGLVNGAQAIDTGLATVNAIKRMPPPELSVKEVTKVQRRIAVKENISKR